MNMKNVFKFSNFDNVGLIIKPTNWLSNNVVRFGIYLGTERNITA